MKALCIELRKEKRSSIIPLMLSVGIFGALYAIVNFMVRKDSLLNLPLAPMDVLLTQLYGMIMVVNMFGIVVATSTIYDMEFRASAIKKMHMLPISVSKIFLSKFSILTFMLFFAVVLQSLALAKIGVTDLPEGTFKVKTLLVFSIYTFITSMPVLSFMILISSRFENLWIPIGIGVLGFLSAMSLASSKMPIFLLNPFVLMMKPAVATSAKVDIAITIISIVESLSLLFIGLWTSKNLPYEWEVSK